MDSNRAAEHLQVIRTLMERSALYRRALAPITLQTGVIGLAGAGLGWFGGIDTARGFGALWMTVCLVALAAAFLLARRQALKAGEPFWSPPTRRVAEALLPALTAGLVAGLLVVASGGSDPARIVWLPAIWAVLYGLALHAAGFFMTRGIKLFGWLFVLCGLGFCAYLVLFQPDTQWPRLAVAHGAMGVLFGGCHVAYGCYLSFTEPRKNET
jgi:hypothetical protein